MSSNNTTLQVSVAELQAAELTKLTPPILYTSLMMLMGACGNSVVCYVYGFRWQSTVTKIFIFSLAALDLSNSLICMPTEIAILVRFVTFDAPSWCRISRFLTYTLNGGSSLILVSIALDRWYKVCRPLEYFFTIRRAKLTCVGAVVLAATLSWPALVLYGNLTIPIAGSDVSGVTCLVSDEYIDTWLPLVFYSLFFTCYLVLVVVITVLYALIAVRLVSLKRQQKERLRAKYAGLRSSRLIYASQESIPLTEKNGLANASDGNDDTPLCGVKIQMISEEAEVLNEPFQSAVAKVEVIPPLQRLHLEEDERRRSVTFILPSDPKKPDENATTTSPDKSQQNGPLRPELAKNAIGDQATADEGKLLAPGLTDAERQLRAVENDDTDLQSAEQPRRSENPSLNDQGAQIPYSDHEVPCLTENVPAVSHLDSHSHTDSRDEDTDEFEQGIHFASFTDINWRDNPIADSVIVNNRDQLGNGNSAVVVAVAVNVKDLSDDASAEESDLNSSLLTENTKSKVQKTKSESFALPRPGGTTRRNKLTVHKTSSDSNLVTPGSASARSSFLLPPGGYPGGHTPTSRLPTPVGTPSPDGADNRPVRLSGALILERLSKKMAYRPAKTTRMLFAISIVFVLSFFPFFCVVIMRAVHGRQFLASLSDTGVVLISIFIRSSFISNAANPIIYGLCNKQFRTESKRLIARCYRNRQDVTIRVMEQTDDALGSANSA